VITKYIWDSKEEDDGDDDDGGDDEDEDDDKMMIDGDGDGKKSLKPSGIFTQEKGHGMCTDLFPLSVEENQSRQDTKIGRKSCRRHFRARERKQFQGGKGSFSD
jgi:hypothetical protein